MSDWIKIGVEFIKALPGQWKGSSDPNAPSEIVDTMAEETPRADSDAVGDESQIGTTSETSLNQQEIVRRREIARQFFNDFWRSTDDKPSTFAERLNRAEGHINERLAARGETERHGSLTPRPGSSLASRRLEPFRSSRAVLELITHSDDLLQRQPV